MKNRAMRNFLMVGILSGLGLLAFILLTRANGANNADLLAIGPLKPLAVWTDNLVLRSEELPSGWSYGGRTTYDEQEVPEPYFWFKNPSAERAGSTLSEGFVVYTTTALAVQSYPNIRDKYFPPAAADIWKNMPELEFQDHADERKIACLPSSAFPMYTGSPTFACGVIARYQNVIVLVNGYVLLDRGLTLSDFRQMMVAVDRRVAVVLSY